MKLILLPLGILIFLSILAMTGLGAVNNGSSLFDMQHFSLNYSNTDGYTGIGNGVLYDTNSPSTRSAICNYDLKPFYAGNEQGSIVPVEVLSFPFTLAAWRNSTGDYIIYLDNGDMAVFDTFDGAIAYENPQYRTDQYQNWSPAGTLGIIALVGALLIAVTAAGIHFLGSGLGEISQETILKGGFYIALWGVFSAIAYPVILQGNILVFIFYFILTVIYAIGVVNSIGGTNNE